VERLSARDDRRPHREGGAGSHVAHGWNSEIGGHSRVCAHGEPLCSRRHSDAQASRWRDCYRIRRLRGSNWGAQSGFPEINAGRGSRARSDAHVRRRLGARIRVSSRRIVSLLWTPIAEELRRDWHWQERAHRSIGRFCRFFDPRPRSDCAHDCRSLVAPWDWGLGRGRDHDGGEGIGSELGDDVTVPQYMVVAQWIALLSLGLLVIVMYRQLGRVFGRKQRPEHLGPEIGTRATEFDYHRLGDAAVRTFRPELGQTVLLAFVDPTCPACEELVESLGQATSSDDLWETRILLVTDEPPDYVNLSEAFSLTQLEIAWPTSETVRQAYRVGATPLVVAIDRGGIVRAVRATTELDDIRTILRIVEAPRDARDHEHRHEDEVSSAHEQNERAAIVESKGGAL